MFKPSAAPPWDMTTSFLPLAWAVVACANTDRLRNAGTDAVPTRAMALPFRNARRVDIRDFSHPSERKPRHKVVVCFGFYGGLRICMRTKTLRYDSGSLR